MELIYQKNWNCTVQRAQDGELLAESTVLGTEVEATGRLKVDRSSFEIKDARWEVFRSPGGVFNGSQEAPGLVGATAYFNIGRDLRRELGDKSGGLALELLAQCVRGIIQAETFLFRERGFSTFQAYCEHWLKLQAVTCRYNSNLDRVKIGWDEYVDGFNHGLNLFNRSKNYSFYLSGNSVIANCGFIDSYHELGLSCRLDLDGRVKECSANFLRAPDRVCFECAALPGKLKGLLLLECSKKQLSEIVGGHQGCDHLVDLVEDLRKAGVYIFESIRKEGV